jgi:hypothetical protein
MIPRGKQTNHTTGTYSDSLAQLEQRIYESDSEHRQKQERAHLDAVKRKAERDLNARRQAVKEANDQEAEERAAQWKEEVKRRYLMTGLMTDAEFNKQWPTIKQREIQREIDARAVAQSALPE